MLIFYIVGQIKDVFRCKILRYNTIYKKYVCLYTHMYVLQMYKVITDVSYYTRLLKCFSNIM